MLNNLIKLKDTKFQKAGRKGFSIYVPKSYAVYNNLENGREAVLYRAEISGVDSLIIMPKNNNNVKNNII